MKLKRLTACALACLMALNGACVSGSALADGGVSTPSELETPQATATEETPAPAAETPAATEAPEATEAPTEAPEATETPEATEVPEATEAPEVTETQAPDETESPAATDEPIALSLSGLTADKRTYTPGEDVVWRFVCQGAERIAYEIRGQAGEVVRQGTLDDSLEVRFPAEACGAYTLTVVAQAGENSLQESCTVYVTLGDVAAALRAGVRYAVANEAAMVYQAAVSGGVAPYTLTVQVLLNGAVVYEEARTLEAAGTAEVAYLPVSGGEHTVQLTVQDAAGMVAEASAVMPVAVRETENSQTWEQSVSGAALTGDWRGDLVAVAQTQLGYAESEKDFIIDEAGSVQGYTRYGAWYGAAYGEWCAMFVSFCLEYAGIPEQAFPRAASCSSWRSALDGMGAYVKAGEDYVPGEGDLVFFRGEIEHVGIVESVGDGVITTIEGNVGKQVVRKRHDLLSGAIIGYASMEAVMVRAGKLAAPEAAQEEAAAEIVIEARWEKETLGIGDTVTLTALDIGERAIQWEYMDESGQWQLAQDGGERYAFELTRENCGYTWRAVYAPERADDAAAEMEDGAK